MMRKVLSTLALVALLALPVAAQFSGFGMGQLDAPTLLSMKSVQDELKLTDEQKKALKEANDEFQKAVKTAIEDKDFSAIPKAREEQVKAVKKVIDKLDSKQAKRLAQIEFQVATKTKMKNPRIFANEAIQKELKLADKQKKAVKETLAELDKDFKELDDDAKGDRQKMFANFRKKNEMNHEAFDKIVKSFDEDQKKAMETAGGDKFELKMEFPGFGRDKGKRDKSKRDKEEKKEKDDL